MTPSTPATPDTTSAKVRLGERLRALRQTRGLTLQQVADASGCSRSFLSMLERGQTDVSVTLLQNVAAVFNLTASDFLPDAGNGNFLKVVRQGEAPRRVGLGEGIHVDVLFTDLFQKIQPVLLTLAPGTEHRNETGHAGEEFVYVLSGEVRLTVHDAPARQLRTGDSAYYPSALPHHLANTSAETVTILTMSTPPRLV